jgi:hypothetical protein
VSCISIGLSDDIVMVAYVRFVIEGEAVLPHVLPSDGTKVAEISATLLALHDAVVLMHRKGTYYDQHRGRWLDRATPNRRSWA